MTFADSKLLVTNDRFLLAKIAGASNAATADVTVVGADEFVQILPFEAQISQVKIYLTSTNQLLATTEVVFGSTLSSGEYMYKIDKGITTVQYKIAGSSGTIYHHIDFDLYVGTSHKVLRKDPTATTGTLIPWLPRLLAKSSFANSIRNMISGGIFTLSGTNVSLNNKDNVYKPFVASSISFSNRKVTIWMGINSNIQQIFEGDIRGLKYDSSKLSFQIRDGFSTLKSPAYFGDGIDECIHSTETNSLLFPNSEGLPATLYLGESPNRTAPYEYGDGESGSELSLPGGLGLGAQITGGEIGSAVCTEYSSNLSNTVNRTWQVGRVQALGSGSSTVETITVSIVSTFNTGVDKRYITIFNVSGPSTFGALHGKGSEVTVTEGAFTVKGTIIYVDDDYIAIEQSVDYSVNAWLGMPASGTYTFTVPRRQLEVTLLKGTTQVPLHLTDHYTITSTSTTAGNSKIFIVLADGLEDKIDKGSFLQPDGVTTVYVDPSDTQVLFRIPPTLNSRVDVGNAVKSLISGVGIPVNDASFTQYVALLDDTDGGHIDKLSMAASVPDFGQSEYPTSLDLLQEWLSSLGSIIRVNAFGEAEIALLEDFGSSSLTGDLTPISLNLEDTVIHSKSLNVSVKYDDIVSKLLFSNPFDVEYSQSRNNGPLVEVFHNISKEVGVRTYTSSYTTTLGGIKIADILLKIRTNPEFIARYSVSTLNIESKLLDEMTVISDIINIQGIVTNLTKSIDKITVETSTSTL